MIKVIFIVLTLSLTGVYPVFAQSVPNCKLNDKRVEEIISQKARQLKGHEYCQFRRYNSINDIDGDGKDDFVVIYTVEGVHGSMNQYFQFMLVFLSSRINSKPLEIQVGERGERSAEGIMNVEKNKITVKEQVWQNNDALCCPSGGGQSIYGISNGKIIKTNQKDG